MKEQKIERKFLFFYLNTGAGHISAAKVLAKAIKAEDSSSHVRMFNGFASHKLGHFIFERGYNVSTNIFRGAFPLFYDLGQFVFFQSLFKHLLGPETRRHLRKILYREHPTDIISFHFALTPFIKDVLKNIPWKVNLTVFVTDPFTLSNAWFYEKKLNYFVYSEAAKKVAVEVCNIPEENVKIVPFLMNNKYRISINDQEKRELKIKYGFNPDKKMVLLVGGGEGLPGATEIINNCILHKANFGIAVICGRDRVKQRNLNLIRIANPRLDLHVFGFVDFLDELVKICDCAVIKAGPAMLMEVLSCRKPVIICKYMHNQELGNMRFAVKNKVGYFIRRPSAVYKKINELLNDDNFEEKSKKNFENIKIDTDVSKIVRLLLDK